MRLTPLSRAVGQTLARDLPPTGPGRIPLLRHGTEITPRFAQALQEHGIHAVWVEDGLSDGILPDELLPEPVRAETAAKVAGALDEARDAIAASQSLSHDMLAELQDVVALIATNITDSPDAALFLGDLASADQRKLDPDEWALMQSHPDAGVALLDSATISPLVRGVVRDHHERFDGSGYPRGLPGADLGEFARIAAVADVYDAITSQRPYAPAEPPHVGVRVIAAGAGTAFDPAVVRVFQRLVMPFPLGTEVTLPDGRVGVVADVDPGRPYEPEVRTETGVVRLDLGQAAA